MVGTTISHYKVIEKIGQGGMGEVYRAEDTNLSRDVAIKVLPEQFTKDPQRLARFEREAKLLASLNHPNIAAIHSFEHSDDVHFLVLELVPGETLQERVAKGPVPVEEALEVCRQIAEGVEAAHEKGVIHRDLKPANVKVTPEGKVKILDFGLAKAFEDETPAADISQSPTLTEEMTRAGVILGTAAYMSPEQAKGKPVDKRADVFAFGAVLYELLTGKRAFEGETIAETIAALLKSEPDWEVLPQRTPVRIRELLEGCLEQDPHDRVQHIGDARIQLKKALKEPTSASVTGLPSPVPTAWWKSVTPWAAAAVIAAAAAVGLWSLTGSPPQPLRRLVITTPLSAPLADSNANDAVLSPDGKQLVYSSQAGGKLQIYWRSLDDFTVKLIVDNHQGGGDPFFSPDGETVAFFADGKLMKVSLEGGTPVTLCDAAGPGLSGNWGLDDTLVFSASSERGLSLYRVSASGGQPETLADPDPEKRESAYSFPQILPGGKAVVFTSLVSDSYEIVALTLETGELSVLIEGGRQARYVPTGHLVYEAPGTGTLMAVPFDPESLKVTGSIVPVLEEVRSYGYSLAGSDFSISNEGTLVYVSAEQKTEYSLVWVDREGREQLITQEKRDYGVPRISPDGGRVATTIFAEEGQNVWLYDLEEDFLSRFTLEGANGTPAWSPDGQWIVFQAVRAGLRSLHRQPSDGSGSPEQLTGESGFALMPSSWSPDGSRLAIQRLGANSWDIEMLSMEGAKEPEPFIASPNLECCPVFSPDGKWLAYVSNETGQLHVYVSSFEKPTNRWLLSGQEGGGQPLWSPDGSELFYRSGNELMVVPLKTNPTFDPGKPRVLFQGSYRNSSLSTAFQYYDISPDGKQFLMIKEEESPTTQINVVLNWFEELKRLVPTP